MSPRALRREKGTPYAYVGLGEESLSDEALIDAMMEFPILINRPLVVSPLGVKLCRPSEAVLDILPAPQRGAFAKEDGELVFDDAGRQEIGRAQCRDRVCQYVESSGVGQQFNKTRSLHR